MAKDNPINPLENQFRDKWRGLSSEIESLLFKKVVRGGMAPRKATREIFRELKVEDALQSEILDEVVQSINVGKGGELSLSASSGASVDGLKKWWLNHHWVSDNMSLSQRISKNKMRSLIVKEITDSMRSAEAWTRTAKRVTDAQLVSGDVAGYMWEVINAGRRALHDPETSAKVASKLRKAQANIERLANNGAPTQRLRAAYKNVIDVVESGNTAAIESAVQRAVRQKARYNAERIARTERARAYGQGFHAQVSQDEDAVGWRSELSSRHPMPDICDFHAGADLYGMGEGVYPTTRGPEYPYHPHCTCVKTIVYKGDEAAISDYNSSAGKKFLEKNKSIQKKLLGTKGADNFRRNPNGWSRNLNNWRGHGKVGPELPKKYW